MAAVNTIDKFGRRRGSCNKPIVVRGPPGIGFTLATNKHFDIQNKRLMNIGDPIDRKDGVTRNYVDENIAKCMKDIKESHITYMENQWTEYSKFVYNKITEMIDEVREYIHKEISEVKKLSEDNYNALYATIGNVNDNLQEFRRSNFLTASVESKAIALGEIEAERLNRELQEKTDLADTISDAAIDKNSRIFKANKVIISTGVKDLNTKVVNEMP